MVFKQIEISLIALKESLNIKEALFLSIKLFVLYLLPFSNMFVFYQEIINFRGSGSPRKHCICNTNNCNIAYKRSIPWNQLEGTTRIRSLLVNSK